MAGNGKHTEITEKVPKAGPPLSIPAPKIEQLRVSIQGTSPLICHRFGAKVRKQILDKQMKKAARAKDAKDPQAEFEESLYPMPNKPGSYGFPAAAFKKAAVAACSHVSGMTKVVSRGAFHVLGDLVEIEGSAPVMREDAVRLQGTTADIRFRAMFTEWKVSLSIRFNAAVISAEQIINLLNTAGFAIGVGEWRPQRDGSFGMFNVSSGVAH